VSSFVFLRPEWNTVYDSARRAERLVQPDPRSSCFYARRTLELAVSRPYQDHLSALIHEPTFRETVGSAVFSKTRVIKDLGNLAVHSPLVEASQGALSWLDWQAVRDGVHRRNAVAHDGELFDSHTCLADITRIELAWGVIDAA
jgi:hypothetical protein